MATTARDLFYIAYADVMSVLSRMRVPPSVGYTDAFSPPVVDTDVPAA